MNLLSNLQQSEKVDGKCFSLVEFKIVCFLADLLKLFPSGTQPIISSQVRTMENGKVVSINLAYDLKCG